MYPEIQNCSLRGRPRLGSYKFRLVSTYPLSPSGCVVGSHTAQLTTTQSHPNKPNLQYPQYWQ